MGAHHASVFFCVDYQNDVMGVVEQVNQYNYEPLRERTCAAIRRLHQKWPLSDLGRVNYEGGVRKEVLTQEWPLLEHGGGSLLSEKEVRSQTIPGSRELGHWFLIMLSEYLRPCPSPLGNWGVLNQVLPALGWGTSDCELLFRGLPTSMLLNPEISEVSSRLLTDSDPYWLWLHPGRARSGWLPSSNVSRLHSELSKIEDKIKSFDVRQIPGIDSDNPTVVTDYQEYLQSSYRDSLAMLSTAHKASQGLFMSITLP